MTYLPDVNVWVALAVKEHSGHKAAFQWFAASGIELVAFCRVTQMGLLRLLTNARVMDGKPLAAAQAWGVLDSFMEDGRIVYAPEPAGIEDHWREESSHRRAGTNFWTDAYLAAFASATGCTIVTFDRDFRKYKAEWLHLKDTAGRD